MATQVKNQIKIIHTLKGALGLDDDTYRATLAGYGVQSSKDLKPAQAEALIRDLEAKAVAAGVWKKKRNTWTPPKGKQTIAGKITAMLAANDRTDAYADAMAKRMFQLDSWRFCDADQMRRIVAALTYDAKRRAGRA